MPRGDTATKNLNRVSGTESERGRMGCEGASLYTGWSEKASLIKQHLRIWRREMNTVIWTQPLGTQGPVLGQRSKRNTTGLLDPFTEDMELLLPLKIEGYICYVWTSLKLGRRLCPWSGLWPKGKNKDKEERKTFTHSTILSKIHYRLLVRHQCDVSKIFLYVCEINRQCLLRYCYNIETESKQMARGSTLPSLCIATGCRVWSCIY